MQSPVNAGALPHSSSSELRKDPDITLYTPAPDLPVVSFNIGGLENDEAGFILAGAYNIITRTGLHCAPLVHDRIDGGKGCVRVSFSHLNDTGGMPDGGSRNPGGGRECGSLSPCRQRSALTARS